MKKIKLLSALALLVGGLQAQDNVNNNKFRQLGEDLPTPNGFRTGSGAPGPEYYQQQADYKIKVTLDDNNQRIYGEETITYTNNSPDPLTYLWVQLDQNVRAQNSLSKQISTGSLDDKVNFNTLERLHNDFDGGFKLEKVTDRNGRNLPHTVNYTMMRVELPSALKTGESFTFNIKWWYNINDRMKIGGRSGYEYFPEDDNYLYTIAQFYPRMCVYDDINGWQNKQFLGRGEFALTFGDYEVEITVPADHVVASTGELQNAGKVLNAKQRSRWAKAKNNTGKPTIIVTQEEAEEAEKSKSTKTKTWVFKAENVRDFAFATSRKFIWDAKAVKFGNRTVMAMSYYPKEGNPLWEKYSTEVVAHTLKVYSKYTFDYPYPVAISVHAASIGMEYPMICFNYGRPEKDGTYSERIKYGMMGVIIHEVGHNFFPMIVNSDERQWTWMDEGLNTFVQYLTEQEWEPNYPSRRGPAYKITGYMGGDKSYISPIMTNSESIFQFGNNAYGKPATALNILRETVMGRELFDYAFKEYAQRWMFKHPSPADFFRTMEDASGVDLDWFWRSWFYTTDHVDLAIEGVKWYQPSTGNPEIEKPLARKQDQAKDQFIGDIRNAEIANQTVVAQNAELADFYNHYDEFKVDAIDRENFKRYQESLTADEQALIDKGYNYYEVTFGMKGGIPMPIIVGFEFADGTKEKIHIPAEIWKMGQDEVSKVFFFEKEVIAIRLDPNLETADVNNFWPPRMVPTRFELYKSKSRGKSENKMQRANRAAEMESKP